ncbi:MAG: hypothetical protein AAGP08_08105 [Pseudomonadota bacterium]
MDDATYSRVVSWLKIILPLLALGLLSTLFLVARTVDPAQQLPFADVDVDELAREQRIGAPNYSGVTAEGAAVAVSARSAQPEQGDADTVAGDAIRAEIELPTGERINVEANSMRLNTTARLAELIDDVRISSDAGYVMEASRLELSLDRTRLRSAGTVVFRAAQGELSAGQFELTVPEAAPDSYLLVFKDGVKLIYDPER